LLASVSDNLCNGPVAVFVAKLSLCNSGCSQTQAGFSACCTRVSGCWCVLLLFIMKDLLNAYLCVSLVS